MYNTDTLPCGAAMPGPGGSYGGVRWAEVSVMWVETAVLLDVADLFTLSLVLAGMGGGV